MPTMPPPAASSLKRPTNTARHAPPPARWPQNRPNIGRVSRRVPAHAHWRTRSSPAPFSSLALAKAEPPPKYAPSPSCALRQDDRAALVHDAKYAGAIRADVQTEDISALTIGGAAVRSAHRDRARGTQLVRLPLDGLRPRAVTKGETFRDSVSSRHETADLKYCMECGARLRVRPTGRPPRYCGPACRQRAHRRRRPT